MGHWEGKYVIGLTGNIATGKSLVRRMLEHLGAYTIDADGLSHKVMSPNAPAYKPVIDTFGKFVVKEDGEIDRERLGAIAFAHPEALKLLENITHPIIRSAIDTLISKAKHHVVIVEAIKLLEGDLANMVDAIWVVDSKPELQLKRLMEKRKLSEPEAKKRIQAQNPQAEKLAKANVTITNNGTPEEVWSQVQTAWEKIEGGQEDTASIQAVQTVEVGSEEQASAKQSQAAPAAPSQEEGISSIDIKRPRPADFDKIAELINTETGSSLTKADIMAKFGEKTYMVAEANDKAMGVIAFVVENLVTRVNEFVISGSAPTQGIGKALIEAMEKASEELQSEIVFVFLKPEDEKAKNAFLASNYEETPPEKVRNPAWREAVNEMKEENTVLLSKRLRENLVLKPI